MPGFLLTNKAMADLKEIGRYTDKRWGRDQRNTYLRMLDTCFHHLAANPLTGMDCSDLRKGYRKHAIGSHVIFYRQCADNAVEIVRILHGHMDVDTRLPEP